MSTTHTTFHPAVTRLALAVASLAFAVQAGIALTEDDVSGAEAVPQTSAGTHPLNWGWD